MMEDHGIPAGDAWPRRLKLTWVMIAVAADGVDPRFLFFRSAERTREKPMHLS